MSKPDQEMFLSVEEKEYAHQAISASMPMDLIQLVIIQSRISKRPCEEIQREFTIIRGGIQEVYRQFPTKPWAEIDVAKARANEN